MTTAHEGTENMTITTFRTTDTPVDTEPTQQRADQLADDGARGHADDETHLTYRAAAVYVTGKVYDEALTTSDPAATLDDIADHLAEVMPQVFQEMGTAPDLAAVLLPEVKDRMWAFTVVEHARAEVGNDYGYLFDVMADALKRGANTQAIRGDVPRVVKRLRAEDTLHRIREAREGADGPWAEILDIVLDQIGDGSDPQEVMDQVLDLMRQARAERTEAGAL